MKDLSRRALLALILAILLFAPAAPPAAVSPDWAHTCQNTCNRNYQVCVNDAFNLCPLDMDNSECRETIGFLLDFCDLMKFECKIGCDKPRDRIVRQSEPECMMIFSSVICPTN